MVTILAGEGPASMGWYGLTLTTAARIGVAVLLGAAIGLEREIDDQPAGLRTHLSVCVGAALFGVISTSGFAEFEESRASTNINIDVSRVASQVVVGVGFLGAGLIFRARGQVRNLTTAASIWATAAVGLAAGVGDAGIATMTTVVLLVALGLARAPRNRIRDRFTHRRRDFRIGLAADADVDGVMRTLGELEDVETTVIAVEKRGGRVELRIRVDTPPGRTPETSLAPLLAAQDVDFVLLADEDSVG